MQDTDADRVAAHPGTWVSTCHKQAIVSIHGMGDQRPRDMIEDRLCCLKNRRRHREKKNPHAAGGLEQTDLKTNSIELRTG